MTRNLLAWAATPTRSLTPMEIAMETLLELVYKLAAEPSDELLAEIERRLEYGVTRLTSKLDEPGPDDEQPWVADVRATRIQGLQAYLDGHVALAQSGDDLLAAASVARQLFEQGSALLTMAQSQVEELLVLYPHQG